MAMVATANEEESQNLSNSNSTVLVDCSEMQPNDSEDMQKSTLQNYRGKSMDELNQLLQCNSISKNQKKKIMKQIKWNERIEDRRLHRKQQKKDRKEKARLLNKVGTKQRLNKVTTTENFDKLVHVAIDCKYDHLMSDQDLTKLGKQVAWCYKVNRRCEHPVQYHLCGLSQNLRSHLDPTHGNWDVHYHDSLESTTTDQSNLVYLTAESDYVLEKLDPGLVYIIGGLVDHNHQKGYCHQLAEKQQIKTARLPLSENVDMKTRRVLTVNHVFEILVAFRSTQDWKSAILKVLPTKKLTNDATIGKNERRRRKLVAMRENDAKENKSCEVENTTQDDLTQEPDIEDCLKQSDSNEPSSQTNVSSDSTVDVSAADSNTDCNNSSAER